jgi:putative phage-type endonuclease
MSSGIRIDLKQGTPEWHKWRMSGIGGSDAPAIEGTSPYKTVRQLHMEKAGLSTEDTGPSEFMASMGHRTESIIRAEFQKLVKTDILPACYQDKEIPFLLASLDGFDSKLGVLEGKLVGQDVLKKALSDAEIPNFHNTQLQHQMRVTGADVGRWYGHDGKKNGALVIVERDEEFIKRLVEMEQKFWSDVKAGKIPPLSDRDYFYPENNGLLIELRDAKELVENAKTAFDSLKEKAIESYKHVKIAGGGVRLFKTTRKGSVEYLEIPEVKAALEKLDPAYIETFRKEGTESWTLQIEKTKVKT